MNDVVGSNSLPWYWGRRGRRELFDSILLTSVWLIGIFYHSFSSNKQYSGRFNYFRQEWRAKIKIISVDMQEEERFKANATISVFL